MRRDQAEDGCAAPRHDGRRGFLKCAAGIAGVAAAGLGGPAAAAADRPVGGLRDGGPLPDKVPFHGDHQAGIVTPQQLFAGFVGFDVLAQDRDGLISLFQRLTRRSRVLTAGVKPQDEQVASEGPPPTPSASPSAWAPPVRRPLPDCPGTSPGTSRRCRRSPTTGWSRPAAMAICRCRSVPSTRTPSSMCCAIWRGRRRGCCGPLAR